MKAILVIDKAESCTSCLLGIYNKKWFCLATNKDIDICDRYNIPSWCPLKPMPKEFSITKLYEDEQDSTKMLVETAIMKVYADGWNDCLEEIMEE